MRSFTKLACAALVLSVVTPALAGERTNLSALSTLPSPKEAESPGKTLGVPGLTLKEESPANEPSHYEIKAATGQGYCLVNRENVFELEPTTTETDHHELWRLVEKDGSATLEKTIYQVAPYLNNAWIKSKASVELKALATDFGITAWGMRETNGDVVVLARRATFGRESTTMRAESEPLFGNSSSSCTFGAVRVLAASLKGGGSAQLTGRLPAVGEGKSRTEPQFIIDVTALKLSRDPEPVLSVRFRKRSEG